MDDDIRRMVEKFRYEQSPQGQADRMAEQRRDESSDADREQEHTKYLERHAAERVNQLEELYRSVIWAVGEFYAWCLYYGVTPADEEIPHASLWRRLFKADQQPGKWTLFERQLTDQGIAETRDPEKGTSRFVCDEIVHSRLLLSGNGTLYTSRGKVLRFMRSDIIKRKEVPQYVVYDLELLRYECKSYPERHVDYYPDKINLEPESYFKGVPPHSSGLPYNIARIVADTPYDWWE